MRFSVIALSRALRIGGIAGDCSCASLTGAGVGAAAPGRAISAANSAAANIIFLDTMPSPKFYIDAIRSWRKHQLLALTTIIRRYKHLVF